jgi:hypothetical protein
MPWMGVGVYLPGVAVVRSCVVTSCVVRCGVRAGVSAFAADFAGFVDFFAALLRAAGFFAVARFFMPRTLQRARAAVNARAGATARR